MKENFKLLFFIKIFVFELCIWICHYNNNYNCGKSMFMKYNIYEYSALTNNRLLSESSLDSKSTRVTSVDESSTKLIDEREYKYKNDKCPITEGEKIKGILLKTGEGNELDKKKESSLSNGIDTFFEKQKFNQLDSIDKIKCNKKNNEKTVRKTIDEKISLLIRPPFIVLFIGLLILIIYNSTQGTPGNTINDYIGLIILGVLIFLGILIVLAIIYASKKIEKREKINCK
ncbi:Plasmodium exported protein, unknown function [Plasmodium malariae]|uniref:PIR Superfamily Protein n=1 Tax=Plasmodium malariae TaxID=5858 RepID=A0A1C3K9M0_PLAMA|nr:Plasmodium exported protein, unknown function [Plasmodium malariae]